MDKNEVKRLEREQAILLEEMSTEELITWLKNLLYYNDYPEDFYYIDEGLLGEVIKRLKKEE